MKEVERKSRSST